MTTRSFISVLAASLLPATAAAEVYTVTPADDVAAVAAGLLPGDQLHFDAGTYDLGNGLALTLNGTGDQYIELFGAPDVVLTATGGDATLSITGSFVAVTNLAVEGSGTALSLSGDRFVVHANSLRGGTVGIDCESCTELTVTETEFSGLSEAALQGSISASNLRANWVHDVGGAGFAISGVGNTILDNVIEDTDGSGIAITLPAGMSAGDAGVVRANFVARSGADGISVDGGAVVATNIVAGFTGNGIASKPGESAALVAHNTVYGRTTCFSGVEWSLSPTTNVLANNAFYCEGGAAILFPDGIAETTLVTGNVFRGSADAPGDSVMGDGDSDFVSSGENNYYPSAASALVGAANPDYIQTADYNETLRDVMPDAGAYELTTANNPGATPGGNFKGGPGEPIPGEPDMGAPGDDAGGLSGGSSAGGTSNFPERSDDGCSCASAGGSVGAVPLLLLAAATLRRRRR